MSCLTRYIFTKSITAEKISQSLQKLNRDRIANQLNERNRVAASAQSHTMAPPNQQHRQHSLADGVRVRLGDVKGPAEASVKNVGYVSNIPPDRRYCIFWERYNRTGHERAANASHGIVMSVISVPDVKYWIGCGPEIASGEIVQERLPLRFAGNCMYADAEVFVFEIIRRRLERVAKVRQHSERRLQHFRAPALNISSELKCEKQVLVQRRASDLRTPPPINKHLSGQVSDVWDSGGAF